MKYVNQINFVLAALAAAAAVYAFSVTYFDPAEPPRIVVESPAPEDIGQPPSAATTPERGGPAPGSRATPIRPAAPGPAGRALPSRPRSRGAQPPELGQPTSSRPLGPPPRPQRQAESPPPSSQPAPGGAAPSNLRPSGGPIRPAAAPPADQNEDQAERDSPRSFPETPEGARRDQNRRGSPNPPPARSSMPEQRPL